MGGSHATRFYRFGLLIRMNGSGSVRPARRILDGCCMRGHPGVASVLLLDGNDAVEAVCFPAQVRSGVVQPACFACHGLLMCLFALGVWRPMI
ncbi:hypothetical protein HMPREF1531_00196 [Propionibacterium sp. oral taxon 192 str. F0372]|nr:hypothetical protein HMPREF1531_00196 [Propionibacterium sp. oral taxon 192 str. F0372]